MHLSEYERGLGNGGEQPMTLANSMLVLMVKGLFNSFHFPYAQFPCTAVTGSQLYPVLWEAVCRLETMGFRVIGLTCDGLSANRRLFSMHGRDAGTINRVENPYSADCRPFFFFSDPPHLVKTVRNAWENQKRQLWVSNTVIHPNIVFIIIFPHSLL